jgi:hypothetical protein
LSLGQSGERVGLASLDLGKPPSPLRKGSDQPGIWRRRPFPFIGDDELHFHAAPPEANREIECERLLGLSGSFPIRLFQRALTNDRSQGIRANDNTDTIRSDVDPLKHLKKETVTGDPLVVQFQS